MARQARLIPLTARQKRAVSRLIEMSRSARYAAEEWLPLNESQRRWEQLALSVPPETPSYLRDARERRSSSAAGAAGAAPSTATYPQERLREVIAPADDGARSDFADEAGYSRSAPGDKPRGPPVISENHVWGVRDEWGPKAGAWGQGVRGKKGDSGGDK